jgi:excinuclease ABC subunit A
LSDVFIRCPDCNGRRYRPHILEVKVQAPGSSKEWSIGDVLEATVDEVVEFLAAFDSPPAKRAAAGLKLLQETGLGYLRLGQPVTTLSGGECQRLKLVSYLADVENLTGADQKPILFLFDEPTTGLHFEDVRVLLKVFQRLVDAGHSVVVIEHNLEVIKSADWVIDLGPDAGEDGGHIVGEGTPEDIAQIPGSYTGRFLADELKM